MLVGLESFTLLSVNLLMSLMRFALWDSDIAGWGPIRARSADLQCVCVCMCVFFLAGFVKRFSQFISFYRDLKQIWDCLRFFNVLFFASYF